MHTAYGMPCYELWEVICLWQCKRHLSTFSDVTWCWCERRPQRLCIDVHYNEPMNYDAQPMSAMSRSHSVGFTKTKSVSVVLWLCKQAPQSVRNADFCVLLLSFYHSSVRWVVTLSRTYKHWQLRMVDNSARPKHRFTGCHKPAVILRCTKRLIPYLSNLI